MNLPERESTISIQSLNLGTVHSEGSESALHAQNRGVGSISYKRFALRLYQHRHFLPATTIIKTIINELSQVGQEPRFFSSFWLPDQLIPSGDHLFSNLSSADTLLGPLEGLNVSESHPNIQYEVPVQGVFLNTHLGIAVSIDVCDFIRHRCDDRCASGRHIARYIRLR